MEFYESHPFSFVDLDFLTSLKMNQLNKAIHQQKAGTKVQVTPSTTDITAKMAAKPASKAEIEIKFSAGDAANQALVKIKNKIQKSRSKDGLKIFIFSSNLAQKAQTRYVTKIAELLATQKKSKILLINGLCDSRRVGSGKITPIYQVLRKSEFINLYSMSFEGYFSTEDLAQQQKRVHELMQLFQISFNFILINQLLDKSSEIETLLCESPFQRFRLHFRHSCQR